MAIRGKMKEKLLKIFDEYSREKAGYIPLDDREELVEKILALYDTGADPPVDWAGYQSIGEEVI